jgi:hypothetical protein
LVRSGDFDGDLHGEFFILIFRSDFFILTNKVLSAVGQDRSVRSQLRPDFEGAIALYVTKRRVELKVLLEVLREE